MLVVLKDEKPRSIWTTSSATTSSIQSQALQDISEMLDKESHTDVTIATSDDGMVRAHRAILAARSKVFEKMFTHKMKETLSSIVPLTDMTLKECWVLLKYMYGGLLEQKDIEEHAMALLKASMKYDLAGLKEVCQTSLIEGINVQNVLTRLRVASDYQFQELREECKRYLLDFGKVWQIKGEVIAFICESNKQADEKIGVELVEELINRVSLAHLCKINILATAPPFSLFKQV